MLFAIMQTKHSPNYISIKPENVYYYLDLLGKNFVKIHSINWGYKIEIHLHDEQYTSCSMGYDIALVLCCFRSIDILK